MGIAGLEVFIPEQRMTAAEIAARSGVGLETVAKKEFLSKPVLPADAAMVDMGVSAARRLLANLAVDPNEIGMLIHASTGAHDFGFWSPAARLQKELGLGDSFCLDVSCGCHAGNYALTMAENHLRGSAKRFALIVVCDALSRVVNHSDAGHVSIFNFGDSATAILIDRDSSALKIVGSSNLTDGRFSDYLRADASGKVVYLQPELRAQLKLAYEANFPRVIRAALHSAGRGLGDVARIMISQGDPQLFAHLAKVLEIPEARIFKTAREFGHMGGSDIFFGLKQSLPHLQRGDLVVLASSAIGFSWGATVIEI